ncbi:MAG: methionine--tRNA ligase subunit beta [bacterium]|nr:methionine--tRNA ligase subunit beta [bacterium]
MATDGRRLRRHPGPRQPHGAAGRLLRRRAAVPRAGDPPARGAAGHARALGEAEVVGARRHQGGRARLPDGQALRRGPRHHAQPVRAAGARSHGGARPGGEAVVITIEQFQEVALRVGTIRAAEPHPNADRLVVLRVDLGSEERQIVAGIRKHYEPEALVGRQVVVVANLAPATLRGVESQGMLLAASHDGQLTLVRPDEEIAPGATVR